MDTQAMTARTDSESEIDPVDLARELRRRGYTLYGIACTLNGLGLKTKRGRPWSFVRVHQVVREGRNPPLPV